MSKRKNTAANLKRIQVTLKRKVVRMIKRADALSVAGVPTKIIKAAETKINAEGWMEKIIDRRFYRQSMRTTGAGKWRALAKSTVADRIRQGFPGKRPILHRTGALFGSARSAVHGAFRFSGVKFDMDKLDVPYGQYHQDGGGNLPARKFFNNPTKEELKPTMKRFRELLRKELRAFIKRA